MRRQGALFALKALLILVDLGYDNLAQLLLRVFVRQTLLTNRVSDPLG